MRAVVGSFRSPSGVPLHTKPGLPCGRVSAKVHREALGSVRQVEFHRLRQFLDYLAALREEPLSDPGSSADEDAPLAGAGWTGTGSPMSAGTEFSARDYCDGQSLASPGRWPPSLRNYPSHPERTLVSDLFKKFAGTHESSELLMCLAGEGRLVPPGDQEISEPKTGRHSRSKEGQHTLLDFRFLELLLSATRDPEVAMGSFAGGVRVGAGSVFRVCQHSPRPKGGGASTRAVRPVVAHGEGRHWRTRIEEQLPSCRDVVC